MQAEQEPRLPPAGWIQAALADIGMATLLTDARGRVTAMSRAAESLTGWPQSEALGKPLESIFRIESEATRRPAPDPLAEVLAAGVPVSLADHTVLIARDGRERRIDQGAAAMRDEHGVIVGAVLFFCDVSERQRLAEVLELSETRYRRLFETAQDGILLVHPDTRRIFDANPFLTDMLGYTRDELVGRELWEIGLFRDIESNKLAVRTLQEKGYIRYDDLPLRTHDDRGIEVEFVSNVYDVGSTRVIQCNIRDVTDRKRAEDALRIAHAGLEIRVAERTAELASTNATLNSEIARREIAEADRRDLQQQLTTVQENERRRIARELHDQMGQHLTAVGLGLKFVKDAMPDPSQERDQLQSLLALTDQIGREVHHLALELRPTALDDLGLNAAMANYVEAWAERSEIDVDFHSTGLDSARISSPIETALYRVVQEALTNVLKHAFARRVSVVFQRLSGHVSAVVEDDGRGFDADAVATHRLGILGMRERVALVGGTLAVESRTGRGTTVIARIPLPGNESGERND